MDRSGGMGRGRRHFDPGVLLKVRRVHPLARECGPGLMRVNYDRVAKPRVAYVACCSALMSQKTTTTDVFVTWLQAHTRCVILWSQEYFVFKQCLRPIVVTQGRVGN